MCRGRFLKGEQEGQALGLRTKSRACLPCSKLWGGIPRGGFLSTAAAGLRVSFRMPSRKLQALHSRAFSHFLLRSSGAGIRTFFKPHCPRLVSQEEVGGSLGSGENPGPSSGIKASRANPQRSAEGVPGMSKGCEPWGGSSCSPSHRPRRTQSLSLCVVCGVSVHVRCTVETDRTRSNIPSRWTAHSSFALFPVRGREGPGLSTLRGQW